MNSSRENPPEAKSGVSEEPPLWGEDDMTIPPRRVLHQPEYLRWTQYFQISLLSLFLLLTAGIFIWYHWFSE